MYLLPPPGHIHILWCTMSHQSWLSNVGILLDTQATFGTFSWWQVFWVSPVHCILRANEVSARYFQQYTELVFSLNPFAMVRTWPRVCSIFKLLNGGIRVNGVLFQPHTTQSLSSCTGLICVCLSHSSLSLRTKASAHTVYSALGTMFGQCLLTVYMSGDSVLL